MLGCMWGKANTLSELVEVQTGTASMEITVKGPQRLKLDVLYNLAILFLDFDSIDSGILSLRYLLIHVHSCSTHYNQEIETT